MMNSPNCQAMQFCEEDRNKEKSIGRLRNKLIMIEEKMTWIVLEEA